MQTVSKTTMRTRLMPYVRQEGAGPTVVCLHSSASSSKQWRPLMQRLAPRYRVTAPDLYGYGASPEWAGERLFSFDDEIELLEPVLSALRGPIHLIGHSYGAAVALKVALAYPQRICRLVLYEPVLFRLLVYTDATQLVAREIMALAGTVVRAVEAGKLAGAAQRFVDYWSGEGTWQRMDGWQRHAVTQRIRKVAAEFDAIESDTTPLSAYARVQVPTLYLYGAQTPRPTRVLAGLLSGALPRVRVHRVAGAGHMGPITHPDVVNAHIERFLGRDRDVSARGIGAVSLGVAGVSSSA